MDERPGLFTIVKAFADVERLRIIGILSRGTATAGQIAESLEMPFREAFNHISFLAETSAFFTASLPNVHRTSAMNWTRTPS